MQRISPALLAISFAMTALPLEAALAQSTRTWVSGVGDDANQCNRNLPCRTFAGAISRTLPGGEIDVLDPGNFGVVTITQSVTIDGGPGNMGSILAPGFNGVNVNAGATDRIILRNLTISGTGTMLGINGINFLAGNSLLVENVKIMNISLNCLSFNPVVKANLLVSNSSMSNCGTGAITSSATSGGSSFVQINNSTFFKSAAPIASGANSTMEISNSVITANGGGGLSATAATSVLNVQSSSILNNTTFGVQSSNGALVRLSQTNVTNNAGPGLQSLTGGQLVSFQNNYVAGNSPDGSFTSTMPLQ